MHVLFTSCHNVKDLLGHLQCPRIFVHTNDLFRCISQAYQCWLYYCAVYADLRFWSKYSQFSYWLSLFPMICSISIEFHFLVKHVRRFLSLTSVDSPWHNSLCLFQKSKFAGWKMVGSPTSENSSSALWHWRPDCNGSGMWAGYFTYCLAGWSLEL